MLKRQCPCPLHQLPALVHQLAQQLVHPLLCRLPRLWPPRLPQLSRHQRRSPWDQARPMLPSRVLGAQ